MVGQVERFGSKLDRLGFSDVELSRQSHVDIDLSRPLSIDVAGSPLAIRWPPEGRRVQVLSGALIRSIDIGEELIRAVSPLRAAKAGMENCGVAYTVEKFATCRRSPSQFPRS